MTETRTSAPPVLFGQLLGQAQRAANSLVNELLAQQGTTFETWVALNTLAQHPPSVSREEFNSDLDLIADSATQEITLSETEELKEAVNKIKDCPTCRYQPCSEHDII